MMLVSINGRISARSFNQLADSAQDIGSLQRALTLALCDERGESLTIEGILQYRAT